MHRDKLEGILSSMVDGVDIVSRDYRVDFQNKLLKDRFGDLTGQLCYQGYMARETPCEDCPMIKAIATGGTQRVEVVGADGREYEVTSTPFRDIDGETKVIEVVRDITEGKWAEEKLREAEQKWVSLTENTSDFLTIVDSEGTIQYINRAIPPNTVNQLIGKTIYDFATPEYHETIRQAVAKVFQTGEQVSYENRVKHAVGILWFDTTMIPITGEEGKVLGALLFSRDITERKRAKESLKESEERYRNLIGSLQEGVWLIDEDANTVFANAAMAQMLGYAVDEMVGKHLFTFMDESNIKVAKRNLERRRRGIKEQHEFEFRRKDGTPIYTIISTSPITDAEGNYVGAIAGVQDITELKRAEESLKESEERYRGLFENSIEAVFTADLDGNITSCNRALEELIGYTWEELSKMKPVENIAPESSEFVLEQYRKLLNTGDPIRNLVYETIRKDGQRRIVEGYVTAVKKKNRIVGFQGTFRDITERKRAEEALEQSEGNYRALFDSAVIGTFVIDAETMKVVMGNQAAAKAFGFNSVEEVIGVNPFDLIPPDDRERVFEIIVKDMFEQDLQQTNEFRVMTKDGREVWISAVGTRILHQGRLAGLVSFADITERKQAEESLKESEERYRGLFENSIEAVFTADLDGNITSCNRALEELIGYTWEELSKMKPVENIAPESSEFVLEQYRKLLNTGDPIRNLVYETIRKDGQRRIVEGYVTAVKKKNRIVGFQGTFRDITERKQAEKALRESQKRYMRLYEGINEAVALYRLPDLKISHWNKRYEDIHKLILAKDIQGVTISDIAPAVEADDWDRAMKGLARVLAGESMLESDVLEVRMRDLEGNRRVFEIRPSFYEESGQVAGVQVAMVDITERKRAEEALQASEEKWRSLAQNAPNIIVIVNRDGKIEFVNRTVPPITVEEAVGKSIYDYMEPQYQNMVKETIEHVFQTGEGGGYDVEGVGPDGRISWYETQAGPIKRDGRVVAVTLITSNVTKRKNAEEQLKGSFINLAETISRAIESRDPYTAGHQRRVAKLARLVGEKMGLDGDRLQGLYIGGLLHDIGKVSIPASILTKMGELTEEEWALICSHPKQGYSILKDTKLPWPVADMTLHHHERLDGSGYPHGISGDALSLEVRILAVCDVVEAMGSYRPYRPARTKKEVLAEIEGGRRTKYDAGIVDVVLQIIKNGEFEFVWNHSSLKSTATKVPVP
jgi:PAS domain S-box-containing protein